MPRGVYPRKARSTSSVHVRIAPKKLDENDRRLVRQLYAEHLEIRRRLVDIDQEMADLMQRRDDLMQQAARTGLQALSQKFEVSLSHVAYIVRPREMERRYRAEES